MKKKLFNIITGILIVFAAANQSFASNTVIVNTSSITQTVVDNNTIQVSVPITYTADQASSLVLAPQSQYLNFSSYNADVNKVTVTPIYGGGESTGFVQYNDIAIDNFTGAGSGSKTLIFTVKSFGGFPTGKYTTPLNFVIKNGGTSYITVPFNFSVDRTDVLTLSVPIAPTINVPPEVVFSNFDVHNDSNTIATVTSNSPWWLYIDTNDSTFKSSDVTLNEATTSGGSYSDVTPVSNNNLDIKKRYLIASGTATINNTTERTLENRQIVINYELLKNAGAPIIGGTFTDPFKYELTTVAP